jgi:hypothetical protein
MDVELREALTQGFGPEPAHRPVGDRVAAGHREVRRRRVAGGAVAAALAVAVGAGLGAVALGGEPDAASRVATDPTTSAPDTDPQPEPQPAPASVSTVGWDEGELARYNAAGALEIRPDATVLDRMDSPYPPGAGMDHSVALALDHDGEEVWLLLSRSTDAEGRTTESGSSWGPGGSAATFRDWVQDEVLMQTTPTPEDGSAGYVRFADDGSLVSSHGVKILDQLHPLELEDFTEPGDASAAALVQGPEGKKWYVLVRFTDRTDVIAVPYSTGGPSLADFLLYAQERYSGGEGMR